MVEDRFADYERDALDANGIGISIASSGAVSPGEVSARHRLRDGRMACSCRPDLGIEKGRPRTQLQALRFESRARKPSTRSSADAIHNDEPRPRLHAAHTFAHEAHAIFGKRAAPFTVAMKERHGENRGDQCFSRAFHDLDIVEAPRASGSAREVADYLLNLTRVVSLQVRDRSAIGSPTARRSARESHSGPSASRARCPLVLNGAVKSTR